MLRSFTLPGHQLKSRSLTICQTGQTKGSVPPVKGGSSASETEERDLVNFPRRVRLIEAPPVRLGFIPEEWFQFFYKKTGVTGPYMFGLGLANYLVSKEIYVLEHEYYTGISVLLLCIIMVKKLGPHVAAYADSQIEDYEKSWTSNRDAEKARLQEAIQAEEKTQWNAEGQLILLARKRENLAFQLESEYRQRLMIVYELVKRRLDYHVMCEKVKRRYQHENMVKWVVKEVTAMEMKPEQQNLRIAESIAKLKELAEKNKFEH